MRNSEIWSYALWILTPTYKTLAEECLNEIEAERQDAVERRTSVCDTPSDSSVGLEGQSSSSE